MHGLLPNARLCTRLVSVVEPEPVIGFDAINAAVRGDAHAWPGARKGDLPKIEGSALTNAKVNPLAVSRPIGAAVVSLQAGVLNCRDMTTRDAGYMSEIDTVTRRSKNVHYRRPILLPATVPPDGQVNVVATSISDPTKYGSPTVTISPINFTSQNYNVGNSPTGVAVADINHDVCAVI